MCPQKLPFFPKQNLCHVLSQLHLHSLVNQLCSTIKFPEIFRNQKKTPINASSPTPSHFFRKPYQQTIASNGPWEPSSRVWRITICLRNASTTFLGKTRKTNEMSDIHPETTWGPGGLVFYRFCFDFDTILFWLVNFKSDLAGRFSFTGFYSAVET